MKKIYLAMGLTLMLGSAQAQKKADIESIKSLCGCFDVVFKYAETFRTDTAYKLGAQYNTGGTEWVELIEEQPNKYSLQHLLLANDTMIIKHWREDWVYENTELLEFIYDEKWKKVKLPAVSVKGQWTQSVWGVDDEPRYQGTATWVHVDGKHYWQNTTDAPLPRREYTKRKDYNVLNRTNIIAITKEGWVHEQDNKKVVRKDGIADSVIVLEKGYNYYNKIPDSKCAAAKKWWEENKKEWISVRKDWDDKIKKSTEIKL